MKFQEIFLSNRRGNKMLNNHKVTFFIKYQYIVPMSNIEYLIHTILRNSFSDISKRHNIYKQIYKSVSRAICELRKKIRTRTRARTLAHVRCACKKAFETCVRCACVRPIFRVCDVRSQFRTFWGKNDKILDFFWL